MDRWKELDKFRRNWKEELNQENSNTSNVAQNEQKDEVKGEIIEHDCHASASGSGNEGVIQHENILIKQKGVDEHSTLKCVELKYHPFVILDNLLKSGSQSQEYNDDSDEQCIRRKSPYTKSKVKRTNYFALDPDNTKRRKTNSDVKELNTFQPLSGEESFVDTLISDLDDINEIPFFDISVPREVAVKIFQYVDIKDLCSCAQVSRSWRSIAEDELVWCQICHRMGYERKTCTMEKRQWKEFVRICIVRERSLTANWKSRTGRISKLEYIPGGIVCAAHSYGDHIVAGYTNGQVRMWNVDLDEICVFHPSDMSLILDETADEGTISNTVTNVAVSDTIVTASYRQGNLDIWNISGSIHPIHSVVCPGSISDIQIAQNQQLLAITYGGIVRFEHWDNDLDFGELQILDMSNHIVQMKLFGTDSMTCGSSGLIAIATHKVVNLHVPGRDPDHMTEIHNIAGTSVSLIDVNVKFRQMAVGLESYGGPFQGFQVKLYCVDSGRMLTTYLGHTWIISCLTLDGCPPNAMATGCGDRKVRVYDLRLESPVMTLAGHKHRVSTVQMDDWKVVSGGDDGLVCVWDHRMASKLWEWHNWHPVKYCHFQERSLIVANIPQEKYVYIDDFESTMHRRVRGSVQVYDFLSDQSTQGVPEICSSAYDQPDAYNYNIRLALPYDKL